MDLPGWQALREELYPRGLEIVTVALDTEGASHAAPWIDAAEPSHPSLIDRAHLTDELFGFINVPSSLWIDERGMIVRPAEPAWPGATPVLEMLKAPADLPPEAMATRAQIAQMHIEPERTPEMLRDWVEKDEKSRFALSPSDVISRSRPRSMDFARAVAHFELGQHLHLNGDHPAAIRHWREAHRLDPNNWTYKRQAWVLETGDTVTQSEVYEGSWLSDIETIGAENYYPKVRD